MADKAKIISPVVSLSLMPCVSKALGEFWHLLILIGNQSSICGPELLEEGLIKQFYPLPKQRVCDAPSESMAPGSGFFARIPTSSPPFPVNWSRGMAISSRSVICFPSAWCQNKRFWGACA